MDPYFYIPHTDSQHLCDLIIRKLTILLQDKHVLEGPGKLLHRFPDESQRFRLQRIRVGGPGRTFRLKKRLLKRIALPASALGKIVGQIFSNPQNPVTGLIRIRQYPAVLIEPDKRIVTYLLRGLLITNDPEDHSEQDGENCGIYLVEERLLIPTNIHNTWTRAKVTYYPLIVLKLQRKLEKFKVDHTVECALEYDVPLAPLTTFRVGGPADALARPRSAADVASLVYAARALDIPLTILGGGANVVISDAGIRGLVLHTGELRWLRREGTTVSTGAGTPVSDAAAFAADNDLEGLSFIYAMPGSTGGAVWMNARCYDGEIAPVLESVRYISLREPDPEIIRVYRTRARDFSYKVSPFQDGSRVILEAIFALKPGDGEDLWQRMRDHEADRRQKGHFDAPCAGSIFKNDRAFGAPSGRIIDEAGLRGQSRGGAQVSQRHGNIIINRGNATATDIRNLVVYVQERVRHERGILLEPEVLFLGEWDQPCPGADPSPTSRTQL